MRAALAASVAVVAIGALVAGASHAAREPSCRGELVSPSLGFALCNRRVFITIDRGGWRDVTPPKLLFQVEDIVFLDALHGWVVANDCVRGDAFVYRTSNGGRTWRRVAVDPVNCAAGSRLNLSFVDPQRGWLLQVFGNTYRVSLWRTNDGGAIWRAIALELSRGDITFRTRREGWFGRSEFRQIQQLYVSRNAGRSWRRRGLYPPRGWAGARLFPDVPTFFGVRGVLPVDLTKGRSGAVAFYVSSDGGRTWRAQAVRRVRFPILSPQSPFVRYVPVSIAGPSVWWLAAGRRSPSVSVTTNAGRSWRSWAVTNLRRLRFWSISAADARKAWLTTYRPDVERLFATADGGRSWRQLSPP